MADSNIVLGIDLGTTNSACAVVQDGRASVVRRGEDRIVPSVFQEGVAEAVAAAVRALAPSAGHRDRPTPA